MKKIITAMILCLTCLKVYPQTNSSTPSNVKEIIVIFKTHFDIGYTHRVDDVVKFYRTDMVDKLFQTTEQMEHLPVEQRLTWTVPGWVALKMLEDYPGKNAERGKKIDNAFRSGTIIAHAMPFTMESDICEPEELVRGLGISSRIMRKYDFPLSRSGKQTDVPSHTGAIATVLANSDIKFLHLGCNEQSTNVQTPELFWWEGPDKSRVLTFYSPIYGTSVSRFYGSSWTGQEKMVGKNLLPPVDWQYQVWPAIMSTSDNVGPPTAEQMKALLDEVQQQMPGVKVRLGTMDDFYESIMKENPVLPVVRAEMPDTWIHGVMSDPEGMRMSREVHPLLASTEVLNTQLQCLGISVPSFTQSVATAYENVLLYGEHTWGRSTKVNKYGKEFEDIPTGEYADLEASWEDKTNYIREASRMTHEMNQTNMDWLAKSIKQKKPFVLVYNPLPWTRSGIVEINNKKVYVKDIPPCGYRTFPVKQENPVKSNESYNSIENDFFKIVFDAKRGAISSLYDKRSGREWVDHQGSHSLGQYLNERFTLEQTITYSTLYHKEAYRNRMNPGFYKPQMVSEKEIPYRAASPENGKLTVYDDGYMQTAELSMPENKLNHLPATVLRVTLFKNEPYIDMELTIKDKAKDNWPQADWLCLPFSIENPVFHVHRPLGIMNPATDILPGAGRHLYAAGNGVTIFGSDGAGIAICPIDHPLISLDTPGCWKFSYDFVPQKTVVYVNMFNNQWNTNFRYWYAGTWSSRVRIWALGKDVEKDVYFITQALETRNPLQAVVSQNATGSMPTKQSGIKVSRKGVVVTAFGADPDENPGTLLRVWEHAGISGKLTVTLPEKMMVYKATPVNLRGEKKGEPVDVKSGKFSFDLEAYSPASFILEYPVPKMAESPVSRVQSSN